MYNHPKPANNDDNVLLVLLAFSPNYRSVCEACFKEFETEAMLRIHMKYAHGTNSKMAKQLGQLNKCKKCNKTCTSESQLSLHTSLYCDVSYSCDFCPAVFNQIKVEIALNSQHELVLLLSPSCILVRKKYSYPLFFGM